MSTGDALARGMVKAQFPPAGGAVSQEKWDEMWKDCDVEKYRSDADAEKAGNAGAGTRKTKSNR